MARLRTETRVRARALQLLYAWEVQGRPPMPTVVAGFLTGRARWRGMLERAELLATAVAAQAEDLDRGIAEAVDHWRLDRIGVIEQNILRLALHELSTGGVPPRVAISEAVQLARWFAGPRAPAFVNGVLDGLARRAGQL